MALRFNSQLMVDNLPDPSLDNQFEVIMPEIPLGSDENPQPYQPIVEEIRFTQRNFEAIEHRIRTSFVNVPKDIASYRAVDITMYCSEGLLTQQYLATWRSLVFNSVGEYYNPMSVYKKDIVVAFYGSVPKIEVSRSNLGYESLYPVMRFTLHGCWPLTQDDYKLKYSSTPQRLRINQRFSIDSVTYDAASASYARNMELVSSVSSWF